MLLAGDEFGQSQNGTNNAYCQDNETTWIDWTLKDSNQGLFRFISNLIRFRREHAMLRRDRFVPDGDNREIVMRWGGRKANEPDWGYESRLLTLHLCEASVGKPGEQIYVAANAHWQPAECELPPLACGEWRRFADTAMPAPDDIADAGHEIEIRQDHYLVAPRSVVILIGKERHAR